MIKLTEILLRASQRESFVTRSDDWNRTSIAFSFMDLCS